jgi:RNA polymerase sigma factor (sigma-70 family)
MANGQIGAVARQVQQLFGDGTLTGLPEGQLLDRFITKRDEMAFAALVGRHGPMVLGVCRSVLRDPNDADDAFQATFLILARKAGAIRRTETLGPWLHRVARRVAVRASVSLTRRRAQEGPVSGDRVDPTSERGTDQLGVRLVVHEELDRLPEKYRAPLILCDLEGKTHEEAAVQLGWPVGTLKGRQWRAREQLRVRFTRRGMAAPAGLLTAMLARESPGAVPESLMESTLRAVSLITSRSAAVASTSAAAVALAEGVLKTMLVQKIKGVVAGLAALGILAAAAALARQVPSGREGRAQQTFVTARNDQDRLQGVWVLTNVDVRGSRQPLDLESSGHPPRLEVRGDTLLRSSSNDSDPGDEATFTIDPRSNPKTIDIYPRGKNAGSVEARNIRGIYRLSGDTLTICYGNDAGRPRPSAFFGDEDGVCTVLKYARADTNTQAGRPGDLKPEQAGSDGRDLAGSKRQTRDRETAQEQLLEAQLDEELLRMELSAIKDNLTNALAEINRLELEEGNKAGPEPEAENLRKQERHRLELVKERQQVRKGEFLKKSRELLNLKRRISELQGRAGAPEATPRRTGPRSTAPGPARRSDRELETMTVKPGDLLRVEVLEALPGRPLKGDRFVRPDGTISLSFYGDLSVAGLTPREIKVKLIEHLRKFITDEALGVGFRDDVAGKTIKVEPVDSDRVAVEGGPFPEPTRDQQLDAVQRKLDQVLQELETIKRVSKQ